MHLFGMLADILLKGDLIMEIKAVLQKPYTEDERIDFVVEYNHRHNFLINETENELQALAYTESELRKQEEETFQKEFFQTSLGYIRRSVYIEGTNEVKNFLSDILPLLEVGVPIITYNADKTQNRDIFVTESFLKECKQQMLTDFYFKN